MKSNNWLIATIIAILSLIFSIFIQIPIDKVLSQPNHRSTDSIVSQSSVQPTWKFGYTPDGSPISSKATYGISGYCNDLKQFLEKSYGFPELISIKSEDRFQHYKEVSIECGPHTITSERIRLLESSKGSFSTPFFTTTTKLLIKREKANLLNRDTQSINIGVVRATTSTAIENVYPNSNFRKISDREDAINQLDSGYIDAFVNDEILLVDIKSALKQPEKYTIEPKLYGFTREDYGIVVYDTKMLNLINLINNEWIGKEDLKAKRELEKQSNYNWISSSLRFLVSLDNFYFLVYSFLIFTLGLLSLLFFTHPFFIFILIKLTPIDALNRISRVKGRNGKGKSNILLTWINVILHDEVVAAAAYKADHRFNIGYIDRDKSIRLFEEQSLQPLLQKYKESGLTEEEIEEKAGEDLLQQLQNNSLLRGLFKTAMDSASEEAKSRIKQMMGEAFKVIDHILEKD